MIPNLDPESQKVLHTILSSGTINGFTLEHKTGLSPEVLVKSARLLINAELITASGVLAPETLDRVQFSPLTSALEQVRYFG